MSRIGEKNELARSIQIESRDRRRGGEVVKSKDRIFISGNAATPLILTDALANHAPELTNVEVNHILLLGDDPLSKPGMAKHFRHNSFFVGPVTGSPSQREIRTMCRSFLSDTSTLPIRVYSA